MVVHQGLGHAGGAAGIHNPQGVVKRQPQGFKGGHGVVVAGHGAGPIGGTRQGVGGVQHAAQNGVAHAGQGIAQLRQHADARMVFAAIGDAVATDQHGGGDLGKAVEHGVGAHVGRTHAPDPAHRDHGQKRHHGLRDVGQVGGHPVTGHHALGLQVQGQRGGVATQLGPRQFLALAAFVGANDGGHARSVRTRDMAQHLLRIVHLGTREPLRTGHGVARQHRAVGRGGLHIQVFPHALPKGVELGDRPLPEGFVVVKAQPFVAGQPVLVEPDLRNVGWGGRVHGPKVISRLGGSAIGNNTMGLSP